MIAEVRRDMPKKTWRPEGWDYTYESVAKKLPVFNPRSLSDCATLEAGADAMLEAISEAIEKVGNRYQNDEMSIMDEWQSLAFEDCRQKILSLFRK
jgi:hypothetical protein